MKIELEEDYFMVGSTVVGRLAPYLSIAMLNTVREILDREINVQDVHESLKDRLAARCLKAKSGLLTVEEVMEIFEEETE